MLVGVNEQHWVQVYFDKFWGGFKITVDGVEAFTETQVFDVKTVRRYVIPVGVAERHEVVIEKERPVFFAGFRPQQMRGFVNGVLVATGEA